ncbi:MAG: FRG domain-containing protein [Phycisphaerales bacterium]|nr:FRG domain-containing protein [Phycisphaerales bacterium]
MDSGTWKERNRERAADLPGLLEQLLGLHAEAAGLEWITLPWLGRPTAVQYAFRGMACRHWDIESTLQHVAGLRTHDAGPLARERELIESFRRRSWRSLRDLERNYLGISAADVARDDPSERPLSWNGESIWSVLAIARHYGVPTRLVDWTHSVLIAAFFAAITNPQCDGAVWWFDQTRFELAVHEHWDDWCVPLRTDGSGQRAMEQRAFDDKATKWISKIHHGIPFHRMEVQGGFFTACGRLEMRQDKAIDQLQTPDRNGIPRGRVIIPRALKKRLLDELERQGLRATSLDYPGADCAGWQLARRSPDLGEENRCTHAVVP